MFGDYIITGFLITVTTLILLASHVKISTACLKVRIVEEVSDQKQDL
jgi:hypothetical protein